MDRLCDRCYRSLAEGSHGHLLCPLEPRQGHTVVPDDIPGGAVFENGLDRPTRFYSHSAHRAAVEANGFQIAPRYVDNNKVGMVRWDTVDLEAAKVLVSRGSVALERKKNLLPDPSCLPNEITVSDAGWSITARAEE